MTVTRERVNKVGREFIQDPTCDDCAAPVTLSIEPYGAGVMLVISCPNCGVSYDPDTD